MDGRCRKNQYQGLANIVREHVKFDMFANNVAQFGHHVGQQNSGQKMFVACLHMLKTFSRTFVVRSNVVYFGQYVREKFNSVR